MSLSSPQPASRRAIHGVCAAEPTLGWRVCLTAWQMGLAARARIGNRVRIVVTESGLEVRGERVVDVLRSEAVRMAVEGYSAGRSVEVLGERLSRMPDEPCATSLTVVDLYESGYAETASLNAPSVIKLTHDQGVTSRIKHLGIAEVDSMIAVTGEGEAVLALSPTAASVVTTDLLRRVAATWPSFADPCRFRDQLARFEGERAARPPGPPMAVLFRPASR